MAKCMYCGEEIKHGFHTNLDDFLSCPDCYISALNTKYGKGNYQFVDDDGADGFVLITPDNGLEPYGSGIFYSELQGDDDTFLIGMEEMFSRADLADMD